MPTVAEILAAVDQIAPRWMAYESDNVGLLVGDAQQSVSRGVVTFDASRGAFAWARSQGAELVIAHHPVIWDRFGQLLAGDYNHDRIRDLNGMSCIAAHTNWDSAPGGLNDFLAEQLGLIDIRPVGTAAAVPMFKVVVFVPFEARERLIDALAQAGAGSLGYYDRCAFWVDGVGTFRGGPGSRPSIGSPGEITEVGESRVEMLVPGHRKNQVLDTLLANHPYETPAYEVVAIEPKGGQPIGRIGRLPNPMTLDGFVKSADQILDTRCLAWGDPARIIQHIAVCGGGADGEWEAAQAAGADAFLSGEIRQHVALQGSECGVAMIQAGHYATEHPSMTRFLSRIAELVPDVAWSLYEPKPGEAGRPFTA